MSEFGTRREDGLWAVIGQDAGLGTQQHHPVHVRNPGLEVVIGDHQRASVGGLEDRVADLVCRGRIEHARRFIEQEGTRTETEGPRQSDALLLSPAGLPGDPLAPHSWAGSVESGGDLFLDPLPGLGSVLRPEGRVPADVGTDQGVQRLLQKQGAFPGSGRDGEGSAQIPHAVVEQSGEGTQDGRLAGAAGADEQDPLAGRDLEIQLMERRFAPGAGTPGQCRDAEADG
jgi:hypothetical protein